MNPNDIKKYASHRAVIKVLGLGGGGGNVLTTMIRNGLEGVEFIAANTDAQVLASNPAVTKIQLGEEITKGLGAGADPDIGRAAARESAEQIRKALEGADMVFLTCGMGGGTGSGSSEVAAEIAKELGCLTVAVVTKPFLFEGKRRMRIAEESIHALKKQVDTLITIPNQRLLSIAGRNTSLLETFRKADDVLFQAVKGISDLILVEGLVNVDFADVRAVMSEMGMAMMGTGEASGDNRAIEAAEKAISSPLLEDISIQGARGVLINITASPDSTLQEINEAAELIHSEAHEDANIIWGMVVDPSLEDRIRVTVIATGFGEKEDTTEDTTIGGAHVVKSSDGASASMTMGASFGADPKLETPAFARKQKERNPNEVIKLRKLSVLSSAEDEEKYEIPTFLRKPVD